MSDQAELGSAAPVYEVPSRHIVSVEHPAIIKNVDKAIETLQGDAGIAKVNPETHGPHYPFITFFGSVS